MFDSLADRIKQDDYADVKRSDRVIRYVVTLVIAVLLFGGLYYGVKMLE